MGLDANTQQLIRAVAEGDIRLARKWALEALDGDTTQKNRPFVSRYLSILSSEGSNRIELPGNLKDIMLCEDVSLSFKEGRYYLGEQERQTAEKIMRMAGVSQKLMEMQIPYKNATLLYGPPGTGKTTFGRYVAYRMGLPFCYLNFSRLVDSLLGGTSRNLAHAFSSASANPCVFMLDEVDTICASRERCGSGGAEKELGRVTITLMQEFDRLANDVVAIAATNRLDLLDEAFVSRCPIKCEMLPLDEGGRRALALRFIEDTGMQLPAPVVDKAVREAKDQRQLMDRLILAIAEKLDEEAN